MGKEIERRFLNFDRLEINSKLKELHAIKQGIYHFKIIQFKSPANLKTLRIRDEGFRKTFTIKEKTDDYSIENEVKINDFNEMKIILEKLGHKKKYYNEKIREIYKIGDSELIFDHYPGLPAYIEIESPTEDELITLSKRFNLNWDEKYINFNILYNDLYGIHKDVSSVDITFSNVEMVIKPLISKNLDLFEKIFIGQQKLLLKVDKE
jgi:adenylate cyclase class 2